MIKLLTYETGKIWRKKSFRVSMGLLLLLNLFFFWYLSRPDEMEPELGAYRAVGADLVLMGEKEKMEYISALTEKINGIALIDEAAALQSGESEMGEEFARQLKNENPEAFAKYQKDYADGDYLVYTDSLYKEQSLLNEIYEEIKTVSEYDEYLASIEESRKALSGISIFANAAEDSFSSRNIEKSAEDHVGLSSKNISYYPAKGFQMIEKNGLTDLLLFLSVFLFVGSLITEEKEKGLFYITRATKKGVAACIGAKLTALAIHCLLAAFVLCGSNFLYASLTVGFGNLSASLHSVAAFLESCLDISLFSYILLGILTKGLVLFFFGAVLTVIAVCSAKSFLPQLFGTLFLAANGLAYLLIPAYSRFAPFKYLSLFGLMKPENLYGGYLNFNIAGYPVERLTLGLWLLLILCAVFAGLAFYSFCRGKSLTVQKKSGGVRLPFRPHGSLAVHEGYKILVMGKAALILLLFAVLIGYSDLSRTYVPSTGEQYYRDMMLMLEGRLTKEKEQVILSEQERYEEALARIEGIEQMVASGEISESVGDDRKARWYNELFFYPYFQKVWEQYEHVKQTGGVFLYDTGYRYLFGAMDDSFLIDFLLLSLGIVFAFGNVMAMEYQKKSWLLLSATAKGKRSILKRKILVCVLCGSGMALLPWIFRGIAISAQYPMHRFTDGVRNLPMFFSFGSSLPIWSMLMLVILIQIAAVLAAGAIVLFFSYWRKSYLQALFFALLLLVAPLALAVMGIDFAGRLSLYPIYSWCAGLSH